MTKEEIQTLAIEFCTGQKTYAELEATLDGMTLNETNDFSKWCEEFVQRSATIMAYSEARASTNKHAACVNYMNKFRAKIRKVIGFSIPQDDIQV